MVQNLKYQATFKLGWAWTSFLFALCILLSNDNKIYIQINYPIYTTDFVPIHLIPFNSFAKICCSWIPPQIWLNSLIPTLAGPNSAALILLQNKVMVSDTTLGNYYGDHTPTRCKAMTILIYISIVLVHNKQTNILLITGTNGTMVEELDVLYYPYSQYLGKNSASNSGLLKYRFTPPTIAILPGSSKNTATSCLSSQL